MIKPIIKKHNDDYGHVKSLIRKINDLDDNVSNFSDTLRDIERVIGMIENTNINVSKLKVDTSNLHNAVAAASSRASNNHDKAMFELDKYKQERIIDRNKQKNLADEVHQLELNIWDYERRVQEMIGMQEEQFNNKLCNIMDKRNE